MSDTNDLQKDEAGNIVLKPVTGWLTAPVAEVAVMLAVQYLDDPKQRKPNQIQLVLTTQQCIELADILKRKATGILENKSAQKPN